MKLINGLIAPLLIALTGLGILWLSLPGGVKEAESQPPASPQAIGAAAVVLSGNDLQLSGGGGSLPEIATNGTFVGLVYEQGGNVFLRGAQTKWAIARQLDTVSGNTPKLAFDRAAGVTNTVHVVWSGFSGASAQRVIRHIRCTLAEPTITCGTIHTVASSPGTTVTVQTPDIVVDGNDRIHVVWFENPASGQHSIKSAISTDEGVTWGSGATINLTGGDDGGQPALAVSGSLVHLAYRDRAAEGSGAWKLAYRQSALSSHSWVAGGTTDIQDTNVLEHDQFSNPTVAANSSTVFVTWDTRRSSPGNNKLYGLIGVTRDNVAVQNFSAIHNVTSTTTVDAGTAPADRLSQTGGAPSIEDTLRPSLVISGSSNFVMVWQERAFTNCPGGGGGIVAGDLNTNGTSEIFYSQYSGGAWGTETTTLADNIAEYSIDPDIVIDPNNGNRHIVFMKATGIAQGSCFDGGATINSYAIYYRGPITQTASSGGVYLPLIVK